MTVYVLTAVVIIQNLLLGYLLTDARKERAELQDRLMAMANPVHLTAYKALADPEPGDVTYVDEAREAELSPSWNTD